jgi:hypothetical protein
MVNEQIAAFGTWTTEAKSVINLQFDNCGQEVVYNKAVGLLKLSWFDFVEMGNIP